jgi:hypothetical protein
MVFLGAKCSRKLKQCEPVTSMSLMVWHFARRITSSHFSQDSLFIYSMSVIHSAKIVYITGNELIMRFSVIWKLIWHITVKCWWTFIELHDLTSQKMIFIFAISVRTSNLILLNITLRLPKENVRSKVFTALTLKNVFWYIKTQFVLHRRHITSPLQSPAN